MLTRIVKMEFQTDKVSDFLANFEEIKSKIRNFPGCQKLDLLQDKNQPEIIFTYSVWESEEALNKYRKSELFGEVWPYTKSLFRAKPEAWSVNKVHEL